MMAEEFRCGMTMVRNPAYMDGMAAFAATDGEPLWLVLFAARAGRAGALHAQLDLITALSATTSTPARCALVAAAGAECTRIPSGWRRMVLDPSGWTLGLSMPMIEMLGTMAWKQRIMAGLVVALIRGQPIPIDPTDPAAKPLRRYERHGELIGYYACGDDGVDNGGSTDDWRFPFDRPWDPPAP
jgi:hypothetical protein